VTEEWIMPNLLHVMLQGLLVCQLENIFGVLTPNLKPVHREMNDCGNHCLLLDPWGDFVML